MTPAFGKILVPLDFSVPSLEALEYAVALGSKLGSTLHLLHVVEDPVNAVGPDGYIVDLPALKAEMAGDATRRLTEAADNIKGLTVTTQVVEGRPAQSIARVAEADGVDLIVMGTHGRGGFAHLLLGSVAERVIRLAPCPVLAVRERHDAVVGQP